MFRVNSTTTISLLRVDLIDCFKYAQRFPCSFVQRVRWVKNERMERHDEEYPTQKTSRDRKAPSPSQLPTHTI
jgi:hypothetical protein